MDREQAPLLPDELLEKHTYSLYIIDNTNQDHLKLHFQYEAARIANIQLMAKICMLFGISPDSLVPADCGCPETEEPHNHGK